MIVTKDKDDGEVNDNSNAATEENNSEDSESATEKPSDDHEHDITGVFTDSFGGLETDDVKAEMEAQKAIRDRPPSPVVFARTLTRLDIAENVPPELRLAASRRTAEDIMKGKSGGKDREGSSKQNPLSISDIAR